MLLEIIIIVFLILFGVILLMAEIFILPGITIAGIAGAICLAGGSVYAFLYVGDTAGYITILISVIAFVGTLIYLLKSNAMSHIALKADIDSVVDQAELKQLNVGDIGISISRLNPIGKARFNDSIIEVKSVTSEYIDEGVEIEIVKIDSSNALVKQIEN